MALTQHLQALLENSRLPAERRAALKASLQVMGPDSLAAVVEALAPEHPGLKERLKDIWPMSRSRAVHFFRVPRLDGTTPAAVKRLVAENLGEAAATGAWHRHRKPRDHEDHLSMSRMGQRELDLRVRLYLERHAHLDDAVTTHTVDVDVDCRVEYSRPGGAIAEVYGTTVYAKRGLRTALERLLLEEIPQRRNAAQEKYLVPLRFHERNVKAVAEELELEVTALDGADPQDALGGTAVYGKQHGPIREALPADDPRVKARERAGNRQRVYRYAYDHGDGYVEQAEVTFHIAAQHPHVTFTRISSRLAMKWILDAVLAKVAP